MSSNKKVTIIQKLRY